MSQKNVLDGISFSAENPVKQLLFDAENHKITQICLNEGVILPPHKEDHTAFFLVLKGKGIFTSGSGEVELETNGYISIKKGETRGIQPLEDLVVLVVSG
ncbi:MAG: hypothetical protein ACTSVZ_02345 [Promethearchaeota archaeon]